MRFYGLGAFTIIAIGLTRCQMPSGDPASATLAILSKNPASYTEKLIALESLIRKTQGWAPNHALADSLAFHRAVLEPRMAAASGIENQVAMLKSFVFDSLGIEPDPGMDDLKFSLPGEILSAKRGSCVGLSLLFLAYAENLGLSLNPVFLPSHLTLRYGGGKQAGYLETLRPRLSRDSLFYHQEFSLHMRPWYSEQLPRRKEKALLALAFNFANTLRDAGHPEWAQDMYALIDRELAGFPESNGNLGLLLMKRGDTVLAIQHLREAMKGDSVAGALVQEIYPWINKQRTR